MIQRICSCIKGFVPPPNKQAFWIAVCTFSTYKEDVLILPALRKFDLNGCKNYKNKGIKEFSVSFPLSHYIFAIPEKCQGVIFDELFKNHLTLKTIKFQESRGSVKIIILIKRKEFNQWCHQLVEFEMVILRLSTFHSKHILLQWETRILLWITSCT